MVRRVLSNARLTKQGEMPCVPGYLTRPGTETQTHPGPRKRPRAPFEGGTGPSGGDGVSW
ncbi:protein of unknown function [Streptomyces sp. KY70]|nr:protein of unknown function [Streptomyces sp. KY70]